jgi:tRNA U34 2-thiouridine synthase MnmA/TrmU
MARRSRRLGDRDELAATTALLEETSLGPELEPPFDCDVLVRYRGSGYPARIEPHAGGLRVVFREPVVAVVPGQFAVFVRGERVLGGGVIRQATTLGTDPRVRSSSVPPSVPSAAQDEGTA